jgi:hypothetical protein
VAQVPADVVITPTAWRAWVKKAWAKTSAGPGVNRVITSTVQPRNGDASTFTAYLNADGSLLAVSVPGGVEKPNLDPNGQGQDTIDAIVIVCSGDCWIKPAGEVTYHPLAPGQVTLARADKDAFLRPTTSAGKPMTPAMEGCTAFAIRGKQSLGIVMCEPGEVMLYSNTSTDYRELTQSSSRRPTRWPVP